MIRELIEKQYEITLAPQTISDYTTGWGLSSQRPKKQASEQDPEKVRRWLEETYPKFMRRTQRNPQKVRSYFKAEDVKICGIKLSGWLIFDKLKVFERESKSLKSSGIKVEIKWG